MLDAVVEHADELRQAFARLGATNISVFGSVARRTERPDSDVDLLVDIEPETGMFALLRMQGIAQEILGRPVDLIPRSGLRRGVASGAIEDEIRL